MSEERWSRIGATRLSATSPLSKNIIKEEENASDYEKCVRLKKKHRVGDDGRWTAASAAAAAAATTSPFFSGRTGVYDGISTQHDHADHPGMKFEEKGGAVQGWAKPGMGVCQLWAQQASSLKRKKSVAAAAVGDTHPASASSSFTTPTPASGCSPSPTSGSGLSMRTASVAVGFGVDDPVPASREEKAKLVGGYLGTSRPGYGNEAMKREWWPAEVPWLKGMSISQMNNATLHTLVVAVKAHQRKERHQALADGADKFPDGLLVCAPKTKKEMSRLIRSIQGRRLQYGKSGKCPPWWPMASAPWDSERPLSTMKHGEVTSIFKAMVREGLLSDADGGVSCTSAPPTPCPLSSPPTGPPGNKHEGDNDRGETTSEERSDRHSSSGSSSSSSSSSSDGNGGGVKGSGGGSASFRQDGSRSTGRDSGGSSGRASANNGRAAWRGAGTRGPGLPASSVGGRGPLAASQLTSYGNLKNVQSVGSPMPLHRDFGLCGPIPVPAPVSAPPSLAGPASLLAMPGQQNQNPYQNQFLQRQREHYRQQRIQAPLLDAGGAAVGLHLGHFHPARAGVGPGMPPPQAPSDSPSHVGSRNVSPAPMPYLVPSKLPGAGPPRLDELSAAWQDQLGLFDNSGGGGITGYGGSGLYGATSAADYPTAVNASTAGLLLSYGQPARSPGGSRSASGSGGGAYCTGSPVDEEGDDHMFAAVGDDLTLDPLI